MFSDNSCWIWQRVYVFFSFSPSSSSLQAFLTHTLSILLLLSTSYFCWSLPLFCHPSSFPRKTAYFLLLRKAELAQPQTSLVDEGKYIILTKERKADVFLRVWLGDVAQRCHRRLESGGPVRVETARNLMGVNVTGTGSMGHISAVLEVSFGKIVDFQFVAVN